MITKKISFFHPFLHPLLIIFHEFYEINKKLYAKNWLKYAILFPCNLCKSSFRNYEPKGRVFESLRGHHMNT